MSKEIFIDWGTTGLTVQRRIYSATGQLWNGSAFEAVTAANLATYQAALTETTTTGVYEGDFPIGITTPGNYLVIATIRAGSSAAWTDTKIGSGTINWDGTKAVSVAGTINATLVATGLDAIPITDVAGQATTWRQMVVAVYRRWFRGSDKAVATGHIRTFADDGVTVLTTQTYSDDGAGNQTLGSAS